MHFGRWTPLRAATGPLTLCFAFSLSGSLTAAPPGYVKHAIPLDGAPAGVAFGSGGVLYAIESPSDTSWATLQTILPDGSLGNSVPVLVDDPVYFVFTGMAYDPQIGVLIADNTGPGRLHVVDGGGVQHTLATGLAGIADVAVRSTGEIFVSTAPVGSPGAVLQVDAITGAATTVLTGLGYGAGLAFDAAGNLVVQDANASFRGRLQRLPITATPTGLEFGPPELLVDNTQSTYDLAIDNEGDMFTTGGGGLFHIAGSPLVESPFDANGNPYQYATGIAFDPGSRPFEPFAGPGAGRLAYIADWFDTFITLLTPAAAGDYNGDGIVNEGDHQLWKSTFGFTGDQAADGNHNGVVDAADYTVWRDHVGLPGGPNAGANSDVLNVPEPAGVILLGSVLLTLALLCRRRSPYVAG